jgi:hypothetical protein
VTIKRPGARPSPNRTAYARARRPLIEGVFFEMTMSKRIICEYCPETFEVVGTGSGAEAVRTVFCGRCYGENAIWWPENGSYSVRTPAVPLADE